MALRYNSATIERYDESDTGVLTVTAIARHPGVLRYRNQDGTSRNEFVSPDFIKRLDADGQPLIRGLGDAPCTLEHPPKLIRDADDRNQYEVGKTKPRVHVYNDGKVEVSFEVFDSAAIEAIKNGSKTGVSLGYTTNVIKQDGVWNGIRYDAIQEEPFGIDHLAIVAFPRAPEARITKFDSALDVAYEDVNFDCSKECGCDKPRSIELDEEEQSKTSKPKADSNRIGHEPSIGKQKMTTFQIELGNKPFHLDSEDLYEAIRTLQIHSDSLQEKLDMKMTEKDMEEDDEEDEEEYSKKDSLISELQSRIDALEGEAIGLRAQAESAESKFDGDELAIAVQDRLDSMFTAYEAAKPFLPTEFKLDGSMSESEIYRTAVAATLPTVNLDGRSDEFVTGVFATLQAPRSDSTASLRQTLAKTRVDGGVERSDADEKRAQMTRETQDAWKTPLGGAK